MIRDYKLIVIVNLLLIIDLVILSTWQIVDPPFRFVKKILPQVVTIQSSASLPFPLLLLTVPLLCCRDGIRSNRECINDS